MVQLVWYGRAKDQRSRGLGFDSWSWSDPWAISLGNCLSLHNSQNWLLVECMVRTGVSRTWSVLSYLKVMGSNLDSGRTWGAQYFCLIHAWNKNMHSDSENPILTFHERHDLLEFDGEAFLDTCLPHPGLVVGLAFVVQTLCYTGKDHAVSLVQVLWVSVPKMCCLCLLLPPRFFLHLFTALFHKDYSSITRIYSQYRYFTEVIQLPWWTPEIFTLGVAEK